MRNQPIDLPGSPLVIAEGQTVSGHIDMRRMPLRGMVIFSPDTLTGTVSVEVSANLDAEEPSEVTWQNLQSGGANVAIGADECVPLDFVCWHGLRLSSGTTEAAKREFKVMGVEEI